jgi:hypothetical protein
MTAQPGTTTAGVKQVHQVADRSASFVALRNRLLANLL